MHKTFISYHHANEQDLKNRIIQIGSGEFFVDKSVKEGDINPNLSEDYIMSKIRTDYIGDSTVVIVLIGEETSQRPYVNSEIQAALWSNPTGLIGVIRDELYDRVFTSTTCTYYNCNCGINLRTRTQAYNSKIPFLVRSNHENNSNLPHYDDKQCYCAIYKFSDFIQNMEKYIDLAYSKRKENFNIKKTNEFGIRTIKRPYGY
ncbi:TPA: TIR domain-containing protein [Streptococcus suis]|uniref:TIR domain-containing protein n=1 Tax=Streptococcus parauberis TaxID=1348 RepID=UPI000789B941|nr:TIR domain-containing protein [Streptococcus parauberis]KYP25211.1 hypothetical protein TM50_01427 [Streptococcus parauberis]KYP25675.1 hypothetical protein ADO04_00271 [Streptococcus parauberis]